MISAPAVWTAAAAPAARDAEYGGETEVEKLRASRTQPHKRLPGFSASQPGKPPPPPPLRSPSPSPIINILYLPATTSGLESSWSENSCRLITSRFSPTVCSLLLKLTILLTKKKMLPRRVVPTPGQSRPRWPFVTSPKPPIQTRLSFERVMLWLDRLSNCQYNRFKLPCGLPAAPPTRASGHAPLWRRSCDSPLLADQRGQEAGGVILVAALQAALLAAARGERRR